MQQEWKYIYQIYQDGSFSKAAEHLYLTQPALSISIQKIEQSIGMPLFDRSQRPLALTAAGEIYINMIKKTLYLEQETEQQLADIKDLTTGYLCLGGSHYLNAYILPEILSEFSRTYPGVHLNLVEHSSAELARMLSERELDLTFNCNPRFQEGFKRYPAFLDHILLAVPKGNPINELVAHAALSAADILNENHLTEECPSVSLKTFRDQEFILLTEGNNLYDRCIQLFLEASFEPKIKLKVSQLVTAWHLAEHQMALTFISDRLITVPESRLLYYKLDSDLTNRLFYMLLPNRDYISQATQAFIRFFSDRMR